MDVRVPLMSEALFIQAVCYLVGLGWAFGGDDQRILIGLPQFGPRLWTLRQRCSQCVCSKAVSAPSFLEPSMDAGEKPREETGRERQSAGREPVLLSRLSWVLGDLEVLVALVLIESMFRADSKRRADPSRSGKYFWLKNQNGSKKDFHEWSDSLWGQVWLKNTKHSPKLTVTVS